MKKIFVNLLVGIVVLYFITLSVMTPYYNWQYAREHGFIKWIFLGEIVATLKSTVWPYFVFFSDHGSQTNSPDERHYGERARGNLRTDKLCSFFISHPFAPLSRHTQTKTDLISCWTRQEINCQAPFDRIAKGLCLAEGMGDVGNPGTIFWSYPGETKENSGFTGQAGQARTDAGKVRSEGTELSPIANFVNLLLPDCLQGLLVYFIPYPESCPLAKAI